MSRECYGCGHDNPLDHTFCSQCGSALVLRDYLAASTAKAVSEAIRDRDVLETESAIRVFERTWGWVKIAGAIAVTLLAIVGGGVLWKVSDWWKAVDAAKSAVAASATAAKQDIGNQSKDAAQNIQQTSETAVTASTQAAAKADHASAEVQKISEKTTHELIAEGASVSKDAAVTRTKLAEVDQLRPQFEAMQTDLTKATQQLGEQQKILASTENLAKHIFSSHVTELYSWAGQDNPRMVVVPPPAGGKQTIVYMLLKKTPIPETVQIQYHIFTQPPTSFLLFQNLVVFFWDDPTSNLTQHFLTVSYFPDESDKEPIKGLSVRDGRVFADDQPMLKFNSPDPEFKGNKWIRMQPAPPAVSR